MKKFLGKIKSKFITKKEKREHSEKYLKTIGFLNKYSLLFHVLLSCAVVFGVEVISRRNFMSACNFLGTHTWAFLYNAFIVFASFTIVYLFRRRTFWRVIITGFWTILGVVNGCTLSNRVTPFGYTDLKCVGDLLTMTNSKYFTAQQATIAVIGIVIFILCCVLLFIKGPKYQGKIRKIAVPVSVLAVLFIGLPLATRTAQKTQVVADYFSNIAQGYSDYGFIYGFSSSVVDRGMSKPSGYSEEKINTIQASVADSIEETTVSSDNMPNVICVLLETFNDPEEFNFFETNEDPIPTFHYLEENFTSGYLTVPVVGAGTANSEFEVLSGMSMQFFGTGEYPCKTILKKTNCESAAADLKAMGYGTHAVHNNGGNFYSRVNEFSMMGFDTFTSKELMDITEFTPLGNWATDGILVQETIKTLDATPDQPDFTYTITVGAHGSYPEEAILEDPQYKVYGIEDEALTNQWTYYVNMLHGTDEFIKGLIEECEKRDEDTIIVMFGDHLPTMGLTDDDMKSGSIYKTKYVTWNNMGLEKQDADLYAYQLLSYNLDLAGIHEGTIVSYHQAMDYDVDEEYLAGLEQLQYDILYGNRYAYNGEDKYPATDIVMGIDNVVITRTNETADNSRVLICGNNFTKWSKVYVNGEKVSTKYLSSNVVSVSKSKLVDGDSIVVSQVGSNNTRFRDSNEWIYVDPQAQETENRENTESTQNSENAETAQNVNVAE